MSTNFFWICDDCKVYRVFHNAATPLIRNNKKGYLDKRWIEGFLTWAEKLRKYFNGYTYRQEFLRDVENIVRFLIEHKGHKVWQSNDIALMWDYEKQCYSGLEDHKREI